MWGRLLQLRMLACCALALPSPGYYLQAPGPARAQQAQEQEVGQCQGRRAPPLLGQAAAT